MATYIYQNKEDDYVIDVAGFSKKTRVLLRKARNKSSIGGCITSSPLSVWVCRPRQVFGFASEDERENLHVGGFDQGPFAWEDYKDDYYELSPIHTEFVDQMRRILSEVDFQILVESIEKVSELLQHINWLANEIHFPDSLEECLTENDKVCFFLKNMVDVLSKYFSHVRKHVFA